MNDPLPDDPSRKRAKGVTEIVAADIGGTHARFALAEVKAGRVVALTAERTLKTADYSGLRGAWKAFGASVGRALPRAAGIAVAGPVQGEVLKLTNHDWEIRPATIPEELGAERFVLINDFGAVGHAVAQLGDEHFVHLCGPERALPSEGVVSIVGPGTGLGVALLLRRGDGYQVVETEGGHIGFSPADEVEDQVFQWIRAGRGRVSAERVVAGSGLLNIHVAMTQLDWRKGRFADEKSIWSAALAGGDEIAAETLDRFCSALGAVAGDIALAQGAQAVVIAGGLGLRLAGRLPRSGFCDRFIAKGRFERRMAEMPVKIITCAQPGLYGAAAAFAAEHRE